jgi:hypothetical protein
MCSKTGKVERDGKWYCGVHDPETVAARNAKRTAEFEKDWAVRKARMKLEAAAPDLLALLVESQTSIGGDWRERRDAAIAKATYPVRKAAPCLTATIANSAAPLVGLLKTAILRRGQ